MSQRRVGWFSCGAASAIACLISELDEVAYCDTGSEHPDNGRFLRDCEKAFGWNVQVVKSEKYADTWEVWEGERYLSGIAGSPCTRELKVIPRIRFERPDDIHVFGYTADATDVTRAEKLRQNWPELEIETPLIDKGITKAACISMLRHKGLVEPVTYAMGFPNANCLPCVKATSPRYWALVRQESQNSLREWLPCPENWECAFQGCRAIGYS